MDKKIKFFLLFIIVGSIITGIVSYYIWFYEPGWYYSVSAKNRGLFLDDNQDFQIVSNEDVKKYPKLKKALMGNKKVKLSNSEFEKIRDFLGFQWDIHNYEDLDSSKSPFIFLVPVVYQGYRYNIYFFYEAED